jgi:hypothetical protein
MTPVGRMTGYRDPPELELERYVDLDDPLELAAIAAHRMTFATPDEVSSLLAGEYGLEDLETVWLAQEPATRQLHRRRADVVIAAAQTGAQR